MVHDYTEYYLIKREKTHITNVDNRTVSSFYESGTMIAIFKLGFSLDKYASTDRNNVNLRELDLMNCQVSQDS